jgi:hypothetical protein
MSAEKEIEELRATIKNYAQAIRMLEIRVIALEAVIKTIWVERQAEPLQPGTYENLKRELESFPSEDAADAKAMLEQVQERVRHLLSVADDSGAG